MLRLAILFFVVALIAGFFGFINTEIISLQLARVFFFVFLVLAVIALVGGALRRPPV
jgi:uncharacterized membrane protein YtjA (UPF0391 family)